MGTVHDQSAEVSEIVTRLSELPGYTWDTDIQPFHSVRRAELATQSYWR
jgi:hypothetical protein